MGYYELFKVYCVFDIEVNMMVISCDVIFDESILGGLQLICININVSDLFECLDDVENEGGLNLVNFKYGGKC